MSSRKKALADKRGNVLSLKKELFEGYIRSQQNEYDDIDNSLIAVTWVLKKR